MCDVLTYRKVIFLSHSILKKEEKQMELEGKLNALRLAEQKLPHMLSSTVSSTNPVKVQPIDSFEVRNTHSFELVTGGYTKDDFELIISGKKGIILAF